MTPAEQAAAVDELLGDLSVDELEALAAERKRALDIAAYSEADNGYDLGFTRGSITNLRAHALGTIVDPAPFDGMDQLLLTTRDVLLASGCTANQAAVYLITVFRKAWGQQPQLGLIDE